MIAEMHHDVHLELHGSSGKLVVSGHDISTSVSGLALTFDCKGLPELTLTLPIGAGDVIGTDFTVGLDDRCIQTLIGFGWIPPQSVREHKLSAEQLEQVRWNEQRCSVLTPAEQQ